MNKRQKRKQIKKHILNQLQMRKIKAIDPSGEPIEQESLETIIKNNIRLLVDALTMNKEQKQKNDQFVSNLFKPYIQQTIQFVVTRNKSQII